MDRLIESTEKSEVVVETSNVVTTPVAEEVVGESLKLTLPLQLSLRDARDSLMAQFERAYVAARLEQQNGNVSATARAMGVSRRYLHRLIARYQIRRSELRLAVAGLR